MQGLKTLSLTPGIALLCLGVALVIGLLSSLVPAWSAARTSILDALRASG
jgi:ABC-type antimicrobial peptide transport system permease subunit